MADSASSILLLRIQSTGSNTNLWGGYLNTALQTIEQADKGYQTQAITGDTTISWTNYATGNIGQSARLKLTGSPSSAFTLTMPAYQNFLSVENATTQTGTVKCSGGTGVAIATGQRSILYCDGTDYYNAAPTLFPAANVTFAGQLKGVSTGTASTDAVNKTQMEAAIAVASGLTAPFILVDGSDTTQGYLSAKITASLTSLTTTQLAGLNGLALDVKNSGGDEALRFTATAGSVGGFLDGGSQSSEFTPSQGYAYDVDCTTAGVTVDLSSMSSVMLGQEIKLNNFGNFPMFLLGTVNGQSNLSIDAPQNGTYRYSGSSWGWN